MTDRQSTHGPDCWGCWPKHYDCAVREIERLRRERDVLMEALMPAREALADLDKGHYMVAKQDPGGYAMGNVSVASLVTVIESTRKALALLDGEKGGGA